MKKHFSKILVLALCFALAFTLSGTASAANGTDLDLTGLKWNSTTRIMELSGEYNGDPIVIDGSSPATIIVTGNVVVNGNSTTPTAISCQGSLTIQGSGTLTATGGDPSDSGSPSNGIYANGALTISGGTVNATGGNVTSGDSYGINAGGALTISGGTVTATGGNVTDATDSYGIKAFSALTISGGTVTATGGESAGSSYGIFAVDALAISDTAEVNAAGGTASNNSNGIYAYSALNISGGTVTATGGTVTSGSSYGINANDTFNISGGTTTVTGDTSALKGAPTALPTAYQYKTSNTTSDPVGAWTQSTTPYSWLATHKYVAIEAFEARTLYYRADGKMYDAESGGNLITDVPGWSGSGTTLTLSGIDFTTTAATALHVPDSVTIVLASGTTNTLTSTYSGASHSNGIYAAGALTVSGSGELNVTGGTASGAYHSRGICADGALDISGSGAVTATGGTTGSGGSIGIIAYDTLTISGGAVTATGGTTGTGGSYGISTNDTLTISGGTVTAAGGTTGTGDSYGIYAVGDLTISGGTVTATGGATGGGDSCGIEAYTTATISGGTVTATGGTVTGAGGSYGVFPGDEPTLSNGVTVKGAATAGGTLVAVTWNGDPDYTYKTSAGEIAVLVKFTSPAPPSGGGGGGGTPTQTIPTNDGAVSVGYTQSGGTATLDMPTAKVDEIINNAEDGTATLDLSGVNGATAAAIPAAALDQLAGAGLDVEIKLPQGTVTLDADAAASAAQQAGGGNVTVSVGEVPHSSLTPAQQAAIGAGDTVLDITMKSGNTVISNFDGTITVTVPYTGALPVAVWYLNDAGELEKLDCTYDPKTGTVTFTTDHLSLYVLGKDTAWVNPFTDVKEGDWFYGDVEYVYTRGLMNGTSATTFAPNTPLTRGMFAAVLARMEGVDLSGYTTSRFSDVPLGQYYSAAVEWAADKGIVEGYGDGRFGPDASVTREELVTMLYRYIQLKGGGFEGPWMFLVDYADRGDISDWAYEAVCYCTVNEIVNGKPGKLFDPQGTATRAEVAAMLHRFLAE